MKRSFAGIILVIGALITAGCSFLFVSRSHSHTPGYCYDCHPRPRWHKVHTRCGHYEIKVVEGGYRYRPHRHTKRQEFIFTRYDHTRDKEIREKKQKELREERKKDKKDKKSRR